MKLQITSRSGEEIGYYEADINDLVRVVRVYSKEELSYQANQIDYDASKASFEVRDKFPNHTFVADEWETIAVGRKHTSYWVPKYIPFTLTLRS